jgi:hypothetical protein
MARIEFDIFLKQVDELEINLRSYVNEAMTEWIKAMKEMGLSEPTNQLIDARVSNVTSNLTVDGLGLLTDYARPLKDADDVFRLNFPEISANFPEEELPGNS